MEAPRNTLHGVETAWVCAVDCGRQGGSDWPLDPAFDPTYADADWLRVTCPRCGRDERFREHALLELLRAARRDRSDVYLVTTGRMRA